MSTKRRPSPPLKKKDKADTASRNTLISGNTEITYIQGDLSVFKPNLAVVGTRSDANNKPESVCMQFDYVISERKNNEGKHLISAKGLVRVECSPVLARSIHKMLGDQLRVFDALKK